MDNNTKDARSEPGAAPLNDTETLKERAMDFILKKMCSEEALKSEEYQAWILETTGRKPTFDYVDFDPTFHWCKKHRTMFEMVKQAGFVPSTRAKRVLSEAETLVLLLFGQAQVSYRSSRRAAQQKMLLKWFEESPEFKDRVPSALSRIEVYE